ncbi:MAG: hypothetical protein ACLQFW_19105 [Xanthobacteraceae bacterium]
MKFDRVLKEVLWCLVTEGSISYRRIVTVSMTTPSKSFAMS